MKALRLGFAGTPAFAAHILEGLIAAGRQPAVVYSQPDRPTGRGRKTTPGPVTALAVAHGIPTRHPLSLREGTAAAALGEFRLDILVVAAYGLLLPSAILDTPRLGCINVHASLLPRWRGAAPIERAIMAGDAETGVSIMRMDEGLDTGPVYLMRSCAIGPHTTGPALEGALAALGTDALLECLALLPGIEPTPQPIAGATYAKKLTPADARIHWSRPASELDRQIRALTGRLSAVTFIDGARMQVLAAEPSPTPPPAGTAPGTIISTSKNDGIHIACGTGTLCIRRLQLNRGKGAAQLAADALNGFPALLRVGQVLHDEPR